MKKYERLFSTVLLGLICGSSVQAYATDFVGKPDPREVAIAHFRYQLSSFGIDASTRAGVDAALQYQEASVRTWALSLLAETEDLTGLLDIRPYLGDPSPLVSRAACNAIAVVCERETGVSCVAYYRSTVPEVEQETRVQQVSAELRRSGISPNLEQVISRGLGHADEGARIASLNFLAAAGDMEHLAPVIELTKTSSGETKEAALRAVSTIARSTTIDVARSMYEAAKDDGARYGAAIALARLGDPSKYRLLYDALHNPEAPLFVMAIDCVPEFLDYPLEEGGERVDWEFALENIVTNFDIPADLRQRAMFTLNRVNPARARTFLTSALPHEQDSDTASKMETILDPYERFPGHRPPAPPQERPEADNPESTPDSEDLSAHAATAEGDIEATDEGAAPDQPESGTTPGAPSAGAKSESFPNKIFALGMWPLGLLLLLALLAAYSVFRK